MLYLITTLLVASGQPFERNYCMKFSCAPTTVKMNTTTCIYPDILHLTYNLQICSKSTPYCLSDFSTISNVTCSAEKPKVVYASYPGEPCNTTTDCIYGSCPSGICFGANPQEECKTHADCNAGLRCSGSKCVSLLKVGEKGCESDFDCSDNSGCNKNSTTGLCVPFFSLRVGAKISTCNPEGQGGYSYLCETGVCLGTSWKTAAGVCSDAPVSVNSNPKECTYNSDCKGYTDIFNYTGKCVCGVNQYAASYCQPFFGDLQGAKYLKALKNFFSGGLVKQCNTMRRYSKECWNMFGYSELYKSLVSAKYEFENYPKLQNNDLCVQSVYFSEYYKPDYSGAWRIVGLWIVMLLL